MGLNITNPIEIEKTDYGITKILLITVGLHLAA